MRSLDARKTPQIKRKWKYKYTKLNHQPPRTLPGTNFGSPCGTIPNVNRAVPHSYPPCKHAHSYPGGGLKRTIRSPHGKQSSHIDVDHELSGTTA